jgi:hypothetical protein
MLTQLRPKPTISEAKTYFVQLIDFLKNTADTFFSVSSRYPSTPLDTSTSNNRGDQADQDRNQAALAPMPSQSSVSCNAKAPRHKNSSFKTGITVTPDNSRSNSPNFALTHCSQPISPYHPPLNVPADRDNSSSPTQAQPHTEAYSRDSSPVLTATNGGGSTPQKNRRIDLTLLPPLLRRHKSDQETSKPRPIVTIQTPPSPSEVFVIQAETGNHSSSAATYTFDSSLTIPITQNEVGLGSRRPGRLEAIRPRLKINKSPFK